VSAQARLMAWITGVLLASGALAWVVKDFADRQQQKGADTVIIAQTAASNDTIAAALKPLLKQSIDTLPAQQLRAQLYEPVRDSVIAELNAIDSAAANATTKPNGEMPTRAVPDSMGAIPPVVPAALSPLPATPVPIPELDPAQVRRALKDADSTVKVCTVPFATCAKENALFKKQLHNDTLTIQSLLDQQPTVGDRIRHDLGIGAIGAGIATVLLLVFHH